MSERTAPFATKDSVCTAILERAEHIACSIAERDYGIVRELWDAFHTKVPELLALLIALGMVADDGRDTDALARFLYELKQRIDPGEEHVWELPHPAPRYAGWLLRQRRLPHELVVIKALRRGAFHTSKSGHGCEVSDLVIAAKAGEEGDGGIDHALGLGDHNSTAAEAGQLVPLPGMVALEPVGLIPGSGSHRR